MSVCYGIDMHATGRKGLMEMSGIHGGDIYRNDVKVDFSVNVNPLGIPKAVEAALYEAVDKFGLIKKDEFGNAFYTEEGVEFGKKILKRVYNLIKMR